MTNAPSIEKALEAAAALLSSDPAAALEQANGLAAQTPHPRAFRIAAAALRALDLHEESAQTELQGIRFGFTEPLKRARAAQQSRRSHEAKSIAEQYLAANPGDLIAMTIVAEAALSLNRAEDAESMARQVVGRAPDFPPASLILANALVAQMRLREGAEVLESLLKRLPEEISAKRFLADIRAQTNDPSAAAAIYKDILSTGSGTAAEQLKYAHFLRGAGLRTESLAAIRRAISLAPFAGQAWWTLVHYFPKALSAEDEDQIRAATDNESAQARDLGFLHLAVSILDDRRGDYERALKAINAAQELLSIGPVYDPDSFTRHIDELIGAYTPELFDRFAAYGSNSRSPIFIVGMPRSGSTLLERILGQHSSVEALGELPLMPRLIALEEPDGSAAYKSLLPNTLTGDRVAEMASWYLERAQQFRQTDKPHYIDKYNGNWIRAGLIRLMFPNAKILDIRRNALDSCWAVYRRVLVGDYANDQRHLARHYADYVRFMEAMAAAAPGSIHTVSYEELVADAQTQVRAILDFLGLEFEPPCLDFHLSTDPVRTASSEQVRRPINSEGIGAAEPYRPWLQPLIDELERALPKSA